MVIPKKMEVMLKVNLVLKKTFMMLKKMEVMFKVKMLESKKMEVMLKDIRTKDGEIVQLTFVFHGDGHREDRGLTAE
ncbi:hypothetical protein TSUD_283740 [Trifolium subterraneum]|nr:hypothetical protein TSUD_283740 [Trifolium subterraneum]